MRSGILIDCETQVCGSEDGKPDRVNGKKEFVPIAFEVATSNAKKPKGTIKKRYCTPFYSWFGDALQSVNDHTIDQDAAITANGWWGYLEALKGWLHVVKDSAHGKYFELLLWYIINLKNRLRGTQVHASRNHHQNHLAEFNFMFNMRI